MTSTSRTNSTVNHGHRPTMLEAALHLASQGWPVFPCNPRTVARANGKEFKSKAPLTTNGFHDATTEPDQIRAWWAQFPDAMIGLALPVHLLVIDIDPHNDGSLEELEEVTGPLPETLIVWSGRGDGGHHRYYHRPEGVKLTSTRLPKGIDLRVGGAGYVIAPPSIHEVSGDPYRWDARPVAKLTTQAIAALQAPVPRPVPITGGTSAAKARGVVGVVAGAVEGERNAKLHWGACRAAEAGDESLFDDLRAAARGVGLDDREIEKTIASARRSAGGAA